MRRFWRIMTVNTFAIVLLLRLNAQISSFYAQNIVLAVLSLETTPTTRNMRTVVVFVEK
jgi:hypothetical protein